MKYLFTYAMAFLLLFVVGFAKEAYDGYIEKASTHYVLPSHPSTKYNPYSF